MLHGQHMQCDLHVVDIDTSGGGWAGPAEEDTGCRRGRALAQGQAQPLSHGRL